MRNWGSEKCGKLMKARSYSPHLDVYCSLKNITGSLSQSASQHSNWTPLQFSPKFPLQFYTLMSFTECHSPIRSLFISREAPSVPSPTEAQSPTLGPYNSYESDASHTLPVAPFHKKTLPLFHPRQPHFTQRQPHLNRIPSPLPAAISTANILGPLGDLTWLKC